MAEFTYNNSKTASAGHISFELNCGYHPWVSFKDKYDARSRSFSAEGPAIELRELIKVCRQKFLHAKDLQKWAYDKRVKPRSYAPGEKVWLNSKHIKTKENQKF